MDAKAPSVSSFEQESQKRLGSGSADIHIVQSYNSLANLATPSGFRTPIEDLEALGPMNSSSFSVFEHRDLQDLNIKAYEYRNQLIVASEYVQSKLGRASIAIVLGSGLGGFAQRLKNVAELNYSDVPFLPTPTVKGHSGKIIFGDVVEENPKQGQEPKRRRIMCFAGRLHAYEGYPMYQVVFCARLAFLVGCHTMILTNSSGGCIPNQKPGSVVIVSDHIRDVNYHVLNHSANDLMLGRRHLPGSKTLNSELANIFARVAEEEGFPHYFGSYWYVMGPTYETSAQVRHIIKLGGSCVGMSTVPSILASANIGLRTVVLALCTNIAAGLSDEPLNHSIVMQHAGLAQEGFGSYVARAILEVPDPGASSSTFRLTLNERIQYVTENNNGIVWDSDLFRRVQIGTFKDICGDVMYIRSFLGKILDITENKGNAEESDENGPNGQNVENIEKKGKKFETPPRGMKKEGTTRFHINNREGPVPIWVLQHPFTMSITRYDCPIAFPLKTLRHGWQKIAVGTSATEAVLYFVLDERRNLMVVLEGLQLEGLQHGEANYIINLLYGVIGHKNLYFMNVFMAFDTLTLYKNDENDLLDDNEEFVEEKSDVIPNRFALVQDWMDFEGGVPKYPWPLFPPTDENAEDTKVMFKYGFFGDLTSASFSNCRKFIQNHFNAEQTNKGDKNVETQSLTYGFWPGPNLPSRAEVNISKMAKCDLIGITHPILGSMCRQLGCDGYSIAAVATQEDYNKITSKTYGYGTTDSMFKKDITKLVNNFNNDLISFFGKQSCDYSPASVHVVSSRRNSLLMRSRSKPEDAAQATAQAKEEVLAAERNVADGYEAYQVSMGGPGGVITVDNERLIKISSLPFPRNQPNYQVLFDVDKEWIAVENAARWLGKEWDFEKKPCKDALFSTFSHVFDLCEIAAEYSIDLCKIPHWRGHLCGGFQLSHYHWNCLNPFEWTLKILKNPFKNADTGNNDYYVMVAPNFFNNKKMSALKLKYMCAFYKYAPLFWNLMFIVRVLWKVGLKNIVFLTHLHGCHKNAEEKAAHSGKNEVVCINNYVETARWNCLTGPNDDRMGPRFVPITEPMEYEEEFIKIAKSDKFGFKKDIPSVLTVHTSTYGQISEMTQEFYANLGYATLNCGLMPMVITAQHVGLKKACVGIVDYDIGNIYSNVESFEQVFKMIETLFAHLK